MKKGKRIRNMISKKDIIKMKKEKEDIYKVRKKTEKKQKKKFKNEYKKDKDKPEGKISAISIRKRLKVMLISTFAVWIFFLFRIGWIQFIDGEELQAKAYTQQTLDRSISPKRGTIYDATGKNILAVSSTVNTITINPANIANKDKEKVASALSNIFKLDYEKVLKKVKKRSSIEIIKKKVEKDKADELRIWMADNGITSGINIDEDTKRYYPYNNLASQIIGFCGSDNQGLDGIEATYEKELKGQNGKIVKLTDANGRDLANKGENYVKAIDGNDLVLTIDMNIQGIAEKYLKEACIDNECTDGGNILIMNPKNGDILAMAGYPNYNLNAPYDAPTDELKQVWNSLSQAEKVKNMQAVWRNKAVADTYEPGSTFKLVTASAALEEGLTTTDKSGEFCCTGSINIAGVRMSCWRYYRPHGPESLREALMNSCNPVFIGLGQKIGVHKYYEYLNKFGFLKTTGIDLPGEAGSIFLKEEKVGPVELGTIAFGQRFEVTPIQMVAAVGTIANHGTYEKPRVVKKIIDSQTGEERKIATEKRENVISQKTADDVLSMMETVVAQGTGKNAQVQGYRIGGKTGTSEDGVNTNKYVTSFIGTAPISDPQVVVLIVLYNPTGQGGHQGGGVAAPIGSQILGEVLPYLETKKDNENEENTKKEVSVPDIVGLSVQEAEKKLKEVKLNLKVDTTEEIDKKQAIIKQQLPKAGIKVYEDTSISVVLK